MPKINLTIPEKLDNKLRKISEITDSSMTDLIKKSLERYFKETNLNFHFPTFSGQFTSDIINKGV